MTTLVAPAAAGETRLRVASVADTAVGGAISISDGSTVESGVVAAVGTPAGAPASLYSAARGGTTTVHVGSTSGFKVGQPIVVGTGPATEVRTVAAVGTAASAATTIITDAAAGDTNLPVASVSGLAVGDRLVIDDGSNAETTTIIGIGTPAGTATTTVAPAAAGATTIRVARISAGFTVGRALAIDGMSGTETAKVTSIGTAAGAPTTLFASVEAGATRLHVGSIDGFVIGQPVAIDRGGDFEQGKVTAIGTPGRSTSLAGGSTFLAAASTSLSSAAPAGATAISVGSAAGFVPGQAIVMDDGNPSRESAVVASVPSGGRGLTLTASLARGHHRGARVAAVQPAAVTALALTGVTGFAAGQHVAIDANATSVETGVIARVGAGGSTTLGLRAAAGETTIKVPSVRGFSAGHTIWIGAGPRLEIGVIASVGSAGATTLATPSSAGATRLRVQRTTGFAPGQTISIGSGSSAESRVIAAVGTPGVTGTGLMLSAPTKLAHTSGTPVSGSGIRLTRPLAHAHGAGESFSGNGLILVKPTALAHAAEAAVVTVAWAGATNIKVGSVAGFAVGELIAIADTAGLVETHRITGPVNAHGIFDGTAGATGTGVDLDGPLAGDHVGALAVREAGTGITVTPPLARAHTQGATARGLGTGIGITPPATAHAAGVSVRATGTGITVRPLTRAHPSGARVRDQDRAGTGIAFAPALSRSHPVGTPARGGGTGITLTAPLRRALAAGAGVNTSGMSLTESRTEFSLWAEEAAPLIAGTDIVHIAAANLAIYKNAEVIAIDQDALGVQARVVRSADSHWILTRPLANGDTAVLFFNAASTAWNPVASPFASIGLDPHTTYVAHDLWTHASSRVTGALDPARIPPHGMAMYRLSPATGMSAVIPADLELPSAGVPKPASLPGGTYSDSAPAHPASQRSAPGVDSHALAADARHVRGRPLIHGVNSGRPDDGRRSMGLRVPDRPSSPASSGSAAGGRVGCNSRAG